MIQHADKALFGSEDLSFCLETILGTFLFSYCENKEKRAAKNVYNPHFRIDEDALGVRIKTHIVFVNHRLNFE